MRIALTFTLALVATVLPLLDDRFATFLAEIADVVEADANGEIVQDPVRYGRSDEEGLQVHLDGLGLARFRHDVGERHARRLPGFPSSSYGCRPGRYAL